MSKYSNKNVPNIITLSGIQDRMSKHLFAELVGPEMLAENLTLVFNLMQIYGLGEHNYLFQNNLGK